MENGIIITNDCIFIDTIQLADSIIFNEFDENENIDMFDFHETIEEYMADVLHEVQSKVFDYGIKNGYTIDGMTYEEWKK